MFVDTQRLYLDHLFMNAKVSVRVEIGDIEVRTRTRRPLCFVLLLLLRNPRIGTAALLVEPAAAAPARPTSSQLGAITNASVEVAIVECAFAYSGGGAAPIASARRLKH